MKAAPNFEPMPCYYGVDHTPSSLQAKSSCSNSPCNGDILTPLEHQIYHQTMTKNRYRLSLRSRFGGLPSRPVKTAWCLHRSLELVNASLWPLGPGNLICAHGTILTNRESFELVGERIFYALQVRTWTI